MKVSNSKDNVELSNTARAGRSRRAEAAAEKSRAAEAGTAGKEGAANVELSSDAKLLARGIDAARSAEVSDKEKIAAIKAKIKNGTYEPDYAEVADKMITESIANS